MKRILTLALLILSMGYGSKMQAQIQVDCDEIVISRYNWNREVLDLMHPAKAAEICALSKATFVFVDEVPQGATVLDINVLTDKKTGQLVDDSYTDGVLMCNYYRFNYLYFQIENGQENALYFRLHDSQHPYLMLRPYAEASRDAQEYVGKHFGDK